MCADFYAGEGDTPTMPIQVKAADANGVLQPVNCTGATAVIDITPIHGGTKIVNAGALTPVDLPTGQFTYTYTAPQTIAGAAAGDGLGRVTVTFGGGAVLSFPDAGYYLITFGPDAPTTAQDYAAPEELKKTLNLTGTTYTDQDVKLALQAATTSINTHCGRVFTQGSTETRKYYPVSPNYVIIDDAVSVSSITTNGTTLVLDTDYRLEAVAVAKPGPPYDVVRNMAIPGVYGAMGYGFIAQSPLSVTGVFGWPSVPAPIKQATMILAGRYLQRSRSAPFAILTFGDGGEAARLTRSDPDVAMLLSPYTRSGMIE